MAVPSGSENKANAPSVEKPKTTGVAAFFVIILGIMLALVFGGKSSSGEQTSVVAPIVLGIVVTGILGYSCFQLFFLPQTRLAEWLATVVVSGAITTVAREILGPRNRDAEFMPIFISGTMAACFLSSGFAWHCAERTNERKINARWRILIAHWIGALGVVLFLALICRMVPPYYLPSEIESEGWLFFTGSIVAVGLMLVPALREIMRARRYEVDHPKTPAEPSTADERTVIVFSILFMPILFVLAPFFLRGVRNRSSSAFRILDESEISSDDREYVDSFNPLMERLGFKPLGFGGDTIPDFNASTLERVWTNEAGTLATILCTHFSDMDTRALHPGFMTHCDKGTILHTTFNAFGAGVLSNVRVLTVDESVGVERLLAIHQKRQSGFESKGDEKVCVDFSMADLVTETNRAYEAQHTLELKKGYTKVVPPGDLLKPTWLGAYRGFFITMPPFKQIREARERRRMNAEVEALGF